MEEVAGDSDIGLNLGQNLPTFKGQILEYLFLSSPTFGEGVRRSLNYQRLLTDAADFDLHWKEQISYLVLNAASPEVRSIGHFTEPFVQGAITFFRSVTDGRFTPAGVDFEHDRSHGKERAEGVLGCTVRFGCPETRLYFSTELLDHPSPHYEPRLLDLHERFASEQIAELEE